MKTYSKIFLPLSSALLLQACASITAGPSQSISVSTNDKSGAYCKLTNDKGEWSIPSTPGSTKVNRAYGDLKVNCQKGDYYGTKVVQSKTKGLAFGNILAGGVIGAAVDVGTGSAYDYPSQIDVDMKKKS